LESSWSHGNDFTKANCSSHDRLGDSKTRRHHVLTIAGIAAAVPAMVASVHGRRRISQREKWQLGKLRLRRWE